MSKTQTVVLSAADERDCKPNGTKADIEACHRMKGDMARFETWSQVISHVRKNQDRAARCCKTS